MADGGEDTIDVEQLSTELEKFDKFLKESEDSGGAGCSGQVETVAEDAEVATNNPTPTILDKYLLSVAKTGDPILPWKKVSSFIRHKLDSILTGFYEEYGIEDIDSQNVPPFNYLSLKEKLLEHFDTFTGAPFTIQRLCEILMDPGRHYKRTDKLLRGLEKNVLVVSTIGRLSDDCSDPQQRSMLFNGLQMTGFRPYRPPMPDHGADDVEMKDGVPGGAMHHGGDELMDEDEPSFEDDCLEDIEDDLRPHSDSRPPLDGYSMAVGSVINIRMKRKEEQEQGGSSKRIKMDQVLREHYKNQLLEHEDLDDDDDITCDKAEEDSVAEAVKLAQESAAQAKAQQATPGTDEEECIIKTDQDSTEELMVKIDEEEDTSEGSKEKISGDDTPSVSSLTRLVVSDFIETVPADVEDKQIEETKDEEESMRCLETVSEEASITSSKDCQASEDTSSPAASSSTVLPSASDDQNSSDSSECKQSDVTTCPASASIESSESEESIDSSEVSSSEPSLTKQQTDDDTTLQHTQSPEPAITQSDASAADTDEAATLTDTDTVLEAASSAGDDEVVVESSSGLVDDDATSTDLADETLSASAAKQQKQPSSQTDEDVSLEAEASTEDTKEDKPEQTEEVTAADSPSKSDADSEESANVES